MCPYQEICCGNIFIKVCNYTNLMVPNAVVTSDLTFGAVKHVIFCSVKLKGHPVWPYVTRRYAIYMYTSSVRIVLKLVLERLCLAKFKVGSTGFGGVYFGLISCVAAAGIRTQVCKWNPWPQTGFTSTITWTHSNRSPGRGTWRHVTLHPYSSSQLSQT